MPRGFLPTAVSAAAFFAVASIVSAQTLPPSVLKVTPPPATFRVFPEFVPGKPIPKKYAMQACGGSNVSPRIAWSGAPPSTKSYVVTMTDADENDAFHLIRADIPAKTAKLPANLNGRRGGPYGRFVKNSFGHARYDGPCPPAGPPHHYSVIVYAIDVPYLPIQLPQDMLTMTAGHILAQTSAITTFRRR